MMIMKKRLLTFGILAVVLGVIFIPAVSSAQESVMGSLVSPLFKMIGQTLMMIAGFFLYLTGSLFDLVVEYTVLEMGRNLSNASGLGGGINRAWTVLRDISNMCFIFVLLYAAFKAMFQLNPSSMGTVVKNIIIAALLINFSLFLSKVVIDASNIVSSGFYRSIVSANSTTLTINPANNQTTTVNRTLSGISAGYMSVLGIQNFYNPNVLTNNTMGAMDILVTGVMGSIFMLVVAVIFLVSAIMFLARFIILIFLMILSPLAVVSAVIPGKSSHFTDWKDALLEQSFFAPLFFALTWVSLKVASTPGLIRTLDTKDYTRIMTEASTSTGALVLNYVLVIGLAIAALVFAKTMAMKGAVGSKYFGKLTGAIGATTAGTAAWAGRFAIGRPGAAISKSAGLQEAAYKERKGIRAGFKDGGLKGAGSAVLGKIGGAAARAALYTSKEAGSGTFDVRNAALPTSTIGAAIQGSVGRTKVGKWMGLDDVNIPSIAASSMVKDMEILGKGETKGYKELREEKEKRVREREAKTASELALAQARRDVKEGAKTTANSGQIGSMEKALAKLSEKETEALVASNRELLNSLNFANAISVKQLEAINKSDQFSEDEKKSIRGMRFKAIDDAIASGAGAATVGKNIRNLSDSELEMISPEYLEKGDFISEMKSGQAETVLKSSKFTTSQKEKFRNARQEPLQKALDTAFPHYAPNPALVKDMITKKLSPKDIVGLMNTSATFVDPTGVTVTASILTHPEVMEQYTPKLLTRMAAADMNTQDIETIRTAIEDAGTAPGASRNMTKLATWLGTPAGQDFS